MSYPAELSREEHLFEDAYASPQVHRASHRTGQNQEISCGMWRLMAHLHHERTAEKSLAQPRRESVFGPHPERLRNPACHLSEQEK